MGPIGLKLHSLLTRKGKPGIFRVPPTITVDQIKKPITASHVTSPTAKKPQPHHTFLTKVLSSATNHRQERLLLFSLAYAKSTMGPAEFLNPGVPHIPILID